MSSIAWRLLKLLQAVPAAELEAAVAQAYDRFSKRPSKSESLKPIAATCESA